MRQINDIAALFQHNFILAENTYPKLRFAAGQPKLISNAAITRAGSIARFERRACSGVGLIA
jgi:hypothetical protein